MSEQQTPPRKTKASEEKSRLRAEVAAAANKVPEFVNAGGIQTTRNWVAANARAQRVAAGGLARLSRKKLAELLKRMRGEAETA